jgi:hypothetical protein
MKGEFCDTCPLRYAEKLTEDLVNVEGGAIIYTVRGIAKLRFDMLAWIYHS